MGRLGVLLVSSATALLGACAHAPAVTSLTEPGIAGTVARYCGTCHLRSHADAMPGALKVFDLDAPGWLARIPAGHLREAFLPRLLPHVDSTTAGRLQMAVDAELTRRQRAIAD